ncbi:uncharacterized protein GLRG_09576 [Colletotrichum graminicola M1.001]|uniref:Uncharacterized protein n=1 Tax=Colletotrichum graminicola (strain M1.001 / M2 / FGSC 10212) TaxID=645133 RepID=E3QU94_COLGM|nr:uncharacterized protein GLRG_09576 [Colletotrichum graminicola M1.001]EFQ34432.1 hypothetical protein GLRG_09576 [Colletotrichum graminicola M1.001]
MLLKPAHLAHGALVNVICASRLPAPLPCLACCALGGIGIMPGPGGARAAAAAYSAATFSCTYCSDARPPRGWGNGARGNETYN